MRAIEVKFNERTFLTAINAILIYQRFGNYYLDLEGWEIKQSSEFIKKEQFNFEMYENDILKLEIKEIDSIIVAQLLNNKVKSEGGFPLTERDFQEMLAKVNSLEILLRKEGLIN